MNRSKHLRLVTVNGRRVFPLLPLKKMESTYENLMESELALYAALAAVKRNGESK